MVSINYAFKEIISKIVYYGPGLSGKTTNLQYVFKQVPSETRGELISLATDADRTLYFDFLPVNVGTIQGFSTKFQLYTVPGQVYYNATRKLVLRGVDGLVFVADSQLAKMDENLESIQNLRDNLEEYGYDINQIPLVIQYNKRDLPSIASIEELERALNPNGLPYFEAVAVTGEGVFKTLKAISKMVLDQVRAKKMEPVRTVKRQPVEAEVAPPAPPPKPKAAVRAPAPAPAARERVVERSSVAVAREVPAEPIRSKDKIGTRKVEAAALVDSREVSVEPIRTRERAASRDHDNIATNNVESAAITDTELPARVVVSDMGGEAKPYELDEEEADVDETVEKSVLKNELNDTDTRIENAYESLPITHDYSEAEHTPAPKKSKYVLDPDYSAASDDTVLVPEIDLRTPMPLGRPQMAESRKVKGKKKGLFGWLGGSKKR